MAADEDPFALNHPEVKSFYNKLFYCLLAALIFYQLPRIPMYLLTLFRKKSYIRLKRYFRTRIGSFILLFFIQLGFFISILAEAA